MTISRNRLNIMHKDSASATIFIFSKKVIASMRDNQGFLGISSTDHYWMSP